MNIAALSSGASSQASAAQTKKNDTLTQQDFMNIFVAQMKYQNPLEPLDNYQIASQMAQFSSLETLNNMNTSLQNIGSYQASMNSLQATGLVGKKVETAGNGLTMEGGIPSEGYYQLSKPGTVAVKIYDSSGALVRTIEEGTKDATKQKIAWDGKNQSGTPVADGIYTFQVLAADGARQPVSSNSWMVGTVKGISFEQGVTYLQLGTGKITLSDIVSIVS